MLPGEHARPGLSRGLVLQAELGVNLYKFGASAATDAHTGLSDIAEDNVFCKHTAYEPSAECATYIGKRFANGEVTYYGSGYNASGLTAVLARENSRTSNFDSMERREAYGTTGPRVTVRLFGGVYAKNKLARRDLARNGYTGGAPTGGDLTVAIGQLPDFLVYALRDPIGANLDRIQLRPGLFERPARQLKRYMTLSGPMSMLRT